MSLEVNINQWGITSFSKYKNKENSHLYTRLRHSAKTAILPLHLFLICLHFPALRQKKTQKRAHIGPYLGGHRLMK